MKTASIGGLLCVLLLTLPVNASLIVRAGDHELAPNTANQIIEILIEGQGSENTLQGINLNIQIADGFTGPKITDVDVVGPGTVFASPNNNGQAGGKITDQIWGGVGTISPTPLTVGAANSVLAKVTIDTTGFFPGSNPWEFKLLGTLNGDSTLLGTTGSERFVDGSLSVVPEPASILTLIAGASLLGPGAYRRLRRLRRERHAA